MARAQVREIRDKAWLAVLLALTGGFVDAVGYLVLLKLFTAHMSGNSIAMGLHLGRAEWGAALHRGFPIPMFILGIVAGATLCEALLRRGVRATFAAALGLEALLLALFLVEGSACFDAGQLATIPSWRFYLLAALPALAMGVQNAALRRVGKASIHTTYISGLLTNVAEEIVQLGFWFGDRIRGAHSRPLGQLFRLAPRQPPFSRLLLQLAIWLAYVLGAVVGAAAELRWQLLCLAAPVACLAWIAAYDFARPLYPPDESRRKPDGRP